MLVPVWPNKLQLGLLLRKREKHFLFPLFFGGTLPLILASQKVYRNWRVKRITGTFSIVKGKKYKYKYIRKLSRNFFGEIKYPRVEPGRRHSPTPPTITSFKVGQQRSRANCPSLPLPLHHQPTNQPIRLTHVKIIPHQSAEEEGHDWHTNMLLARNSPQKGTRLFLKKSFSIWEGNNGKQTSAAVCTHALGSFRVSDFAIRRGEFSAVKFISCSTADGLFLLFF